MAMRSSNSVIAWSMRNFRITFLIVEQIPVSEYTPLQVKQAVVGYGRAEKKQVMELTRRILKLQKIPKPDDAADALAIAICHGHCATGLQGRMES